MAKNYDRREFLRYSLFGIGSFFIASSPLKIFAASPTPNGKKGLTTFEAKQLSVQAKEFFYKKLYPEATAIYQQLIAYNPKFIAYYDGYAKVLSAQQKTMEVAELYRQGLQKNAKSSLFMHRLSLRITDIALGNQKAEKVFRAKYGETPLVEAAATLMLQAINSNKKNKGLYLNLRDNLNAVDKHNKQLEKKGKAQIAFSESLRTDIMTTTAVHEQRWTESRKSRKPYISENVDTDVEKIKNKHRRDKHSDKEKKQSDESIKKVKKIHLKHGLNLNLATKNLNKIEKYGMLILEESINDTDTIGKLRKHYRKNDASERLIELDRYLYLKNDSLANALALASTLCKHSNSRSAISETKELLTKISPLILNQPAVCIGTYYFTLAAVNMSEKEPTLARATLLEGIDKFDGRGGISYSLMERYAITFTGKDTTISIQILQALSGKKVNPTENPIWKYIQNYRQTLTEKEPSINEQLKPLLALAKIQKKTDAAGYTITTGEIEKLKNS